ncbi:hypothetical protein, conserved [Plasmodium gonderi]|uniref:Uncharacterized protein n=1 Tax=Plasmodium gonderi TaxID=77519 RepID=A0A1Y1JQM8_PLAGO|nr:hypothetical protein, conserved [Plasmodium gonderi]GAW83805.1 hypothetical protein, conserved [Plasmodium gonderi]
MKKDGADFNKLTPKEMNNFRLMTQLIELKKHKKAFKICEQILKKYPKNGETLAVKGYLLNLMDEKNKEEAFKLIKEGIINNISSGFCWYLYGCLYKIYKNYDEALKCYLKSIKINRYDYKALKEACILLLYLKKYEQFKDLREDMYKDTIRGVRDKAILIFSYHLIEKYEKCFFLINQMEEDLRAKTNSTDPVRGNDLSTSEKHDLLVYMAEILLEGKMYKACMNFLKTHEKELYDKFWYNKMVGLVHLFEDNFVEANLFFKRAFEMNYENLNVLLLILFTERNYKLGGSGSGSSSGNSSGSAIPSGVKVEHDNVEESKKVEPEQGMDSEKKIKTLSSLFYLDYKDEHTMDEKVNIKESVKILLHEFILDIYGSNRNLKLLSKKEKNILNDYVCHNLEMKKYDIYTISEFNNFVNINLVDEAKFKENLHISNVNEFIDSLRESIKKEVNEISNIDVYSYTNIHWSEKLGVDLLYCHKKKFEKCMDKIHFYKIKNLNDEEENYFENYFKDLQKVYKSSNLLKIFPLYFYNEKKFSFHVQILLRSLCFQKCLTVFSYFKPFFTYKNIKIILFLLHKYIENYDKSKDISPIKCGEMIDGNYICAYFETGEQLGQMVEKVGEHRREDTIEKREFLSDQDHKNLTYEKTRNVEITNVHDNDNLECVNDMSLEKKMNSGTNETQQLRNEKLVDRFLEESDEIKSIVGMASHMGRGGKEEEESKKKNENKSNIRISKKNNENKEEKKEIKLDLKNMILTDEEKKEYFMLCIHSFISQLYDYINCANESLALIENSLNRITFKINECVKHELIFIKGLIYKRNGNYLDAYRYLEKCRIANIGDRFINSKTIKTCLKCGLIKDAKKMASIFTNPLDNNFMKNINETQSFWLEYSISMSYFNNHPNIHLGRFLSLGFDSLYDFGDEEQGSDIEGTSRINGIGGISGTSGTSDIGGISGINGRSVTDVENLQKSPNVGKGEHKNDKKINGKQKLNLRKSILVDNDMLGRNEFNDYSRGLHYLHMGHKQFMDIHEDQICFYYYTIRKVLYRSYKHLLHMTSEIFSSRFYRKFGKSLIKTLLYMHDFGLLYKNDLNKNSKKKNKPTATNQEESDIYEHIKNDPIDNAMIYMKTFLSQPNVDLSLYKLKYDIECRSPVPFDRMTEELRKEITTKLNELLGLNHSTYNDELLKDVRKKYMQDFIIFGNEYKKGDLRYYQSALEMYLDCNEKIEENLLERFNIDPQKNKLTRCFKFLRFLYKRQEKCSQLVDLLSHFKICCRKVFPLATAFQ